MGNLETKPTGNILRGAKRAAVVFGLLCATAVCRADLIFNIYTTGDQTSASVTPGSTLALWIQFTTTDAVAGVNYTLEFDTNDWTLEARNYASSGWIHNDGIYDNSAPIPGVTTFPVTINESLFSPTSSIADISLNTIHSPEGSTATGTVTVESFTIGIPLGETDGAYQISFGTLTAYNANGESLTCSEGNTFTVNVVPEPGTLLLLATGLGGAWLSARRRRGKPKTGSDPSAG